MVVWILQVFSIYIYNVESEDLKVKGGAQDKMTVQRNRPENILQVYLLK